MLFTTKITELSFTEMCNVTVQDSSLFSSYLLHVCVALCQDNSQCKTMHNYENVFHMQIQGFIAGGHLVFTGRQNILN